MNTPSGPDAPGPETTRVEHPADRVRTREELGAALTQARAAAGLSVRDVVHLVPGLSLGTASGWFSGQHVPTPASRATFLATLLALDPDTADGDSWWAAVERVRSRPGPRRGRAARGSRRVPTRAGASASSGTSGTSAPSASTTSDPGGATPTHEATAPDPLDPLDLDATGPYVGLRPYRVAEAPLFFGREAELRTALTRLDAAHSTPLVVLGPSGSGKSSLLYAGIMATLQDRGRQVRVVTPAELLAGALESDGQVSDEQVSDQQGPHATTDGPSPAVLVDQLDELWADGVDPADRDRALAALARTATAGTAVVCTLRADFFSLALAEEPLRAALNDEPLVLGPPDRDHLGRIIVEPARVLAYSVEPALVTLLLDTIAPRGERPDPGVLPLLSHVLRQCWERSRRRRITVEDYYATGGVETAVRDTSEATYQGLDQARRPVARALFLRVVDLSRDRIVRRHVPLADLDPDTLAVARAFAAAGLLSIDDESVTVTHEVVLTGWPRLGDWIEQDRDALRVASRLRGAARDWDEAGRTDDALPTPLAAVGYRQWADDGAHRDGLGARELDYLAAGEEYYGRRRRRTRRRQQVLGTLSAALAVVAIIALGAGSVALHSRGEAAHTRDEALSRAGAVEARSVAAKDPALGRSLALAAYEISPTLEARSALLDSTRATVPARLHTVNGPGRSVAVPRSTYALVGSADGRLRVLDTRDGVRVVADVEAVPGSGDRAEVYDIAVSGDGALAAVTGRHGTGLWALDEPTAPRPLRHLDSGSAVCHSLRFSPDRRTLAAGCDGGTVARWPVREAVAPDAGPLRATDTSVGGDQIPTLAWLGDSRTLLVPAPDKGVLVLDDAGWGGTPHPVPAPEALRTDRVTSLAVRPDGQQLAVGATGRTVLRFDLPGGRLDTATALPGLGGWRAWISDLDYAPDGRLLAAGTDELFRVYGPDGSTLATLPGSQNMNSARFVGPDAIVTSAIDGVARVWPTTHLGRYTPTDSIWQTATDAARNRTVLGQTAAQHRYTVLDSTTGTMTRIGEVDPPAGVRFPGSVALSADGEVVHTGSASGDVLTYTAPFTPGRPPVSVAPATKGTVIGLAHSPTAPVLAACTEQTREVAFVEVRDPARPVVLARVPLPDPCTVVGFSADGTQVVVPTSGPSTMLVDVRDPVRPVVASSLDTKVGVMTMGEFAPSGPLLVTSDGDKRTRLWDTSDVRAPREVASFESPEGENYWVAFSADATKVVTASSEGRATVTDVSDPHHPARWAVLGSASEPLLYSARVSTPQGAILGVGTDGRMDLWELDPDRVRREACGGGSVLTDAEWARYFPGTRLRELCR